jgi:hypothetical protein
VACTDDAIARYLETGAVPPRLNYYGSDKVCPPVPKPNPTAGKAGAASTTTAGATRAAAWRALRAALSGTV